MEVVVFSDPNLDKFIRQRINKPLGDILVSDINHIEYLIIDDLEINNLDGIESLNNLVSLYARNNNIVDVTPLSNKNICEKRF